MFVADDYIFKLFNYKYCKCGQSGNVDMTGLM